jgi:thymidylate kinase
VNTARSAGRGLARKFREFLNPNGAFIAVMGPDGSGKGTLIEAVKEDVEKLLGFNVLTRHLRPHLLPSLGSLFLGRIEDGAPVTNPHAKKPSGVFVSTLRVAYYTLDYMIGYWFVIRPHLGRKYIAVIFDRYYYDHFIDPNRFRVSLPRWIISFFKAFVPTPDTVIFLSADPETIFARKPELPPDEILRQIQEIKNLAKHVNRCVWIDTSEPLHKSTEQMSDAVFQIISERLSV